MIHASTTASARASTARTVDSQTVVQSTCHTSGCTITVSEAWIDSQVMAPGRPGGASLNPASKAVATGVTVSTATTISSNVGNDTHATIPRRPRSRVRAKSPALPAPATVAMLETARRLEERDDSAAPLRPRFMGGHCRASKPPRAIEERPGSAGALRAPGGMGGPFEAPHV